MLLLSLAVGWTSCKLHHWTKRFAYKVFNRANPNFHQWLNTISKWELVVAVCCALCNGIRKGYKQKKLSTVGETLHSVSRCTMDSKCSFLFFSTVSIEEQWQWLDAVRVGRFASSWHGRTHSQLSSQQLRRRRAPNLVLSAQHPVSHHLPGCLPQVLQRTKSLWKWRRSSPPFQRPSTLCSPQGRDLLREVAGIGHTHLYSGLLPTAPLPQPHWGAVGSSTWCRTLAQQVVLSFFFLFFKKKDIYCMKFFSR